ncbi:sensor histidine kinase [Convivina praedatoris]|uniref:histidine kinase n=1 Tax=Convivina praedatoris TaxID=2880963 RepID=A0ABN8HCI6_9LACO|nr:ATP-binding protein [Convivina sp. LMG 32447]CAH1852672.1 Adaptive-response sensory-kinase SasA [Convivina sp. LMG 32447]CAH1852711.1 Adaptive-response sensory-kinase SasA [Convivina sp. LMG 32447]CAH1854864.1 Adaptive-response sensory-kinase SasA [Convivina sp. LMG 32447]
MIENQDQKTKASFRFSLRWQLSLGMALVFFLTCCLFVAAVIIILQQHYGVMPKALSHWMWLIAILGALIVFLVSSWITKIIVSPVTVIEKTIQAFESDPMTPERIPKIGPDDELSDLSRILNRMIDRLQDLIGAQQQFVSDVSHELRTPVAVVKGHMEMLNRWGKDDPEVLADSIQSTLSEVKRMETLINEMLNLTRAEQVPVENVNQITDVDGVVHRTFNDFKMLHPDFILTFDDDLVQPALVNIRQDHLEQIIIILADNAIKYSTDRKEIHFALSKSATRVEIGVQDFGEGIESEDLARVFNRFYRVDRARSREKGGNGLGLSIAERLVKAYGGEITVESALGSGSIFTIRLPLVSEPTSDENSPL